METSKAFRDNLQIILYKAFSLVHNDVITNFIGSFQVLSESKSHKNQDGGQFFKWTYEIVDDIIMNQWKCFI